MHRLTLALLCLTGVLIPMGGYGLLGQEVTGQQPQQPSARRETRRAADQIRRDWLRDNLPRLIDDRQELQEVLARIDGLTTGQVNDLVTACLDELEARRRQQFAKLREANARERAFRDAVARAVASQPYPLYPPHPLYAPGGPVGYFPIVTWLPEGVSLSAQAVVSPDRRSVRMSLVPFFSTIGPVYTFNFLTGETHRLPEFDPPSPGTQPAQPHDRLRGR
jgi:hypothetical protein